MNMTKKINVNFSSLVGLKAELLRKQTEVNEMKTQSSNVPPQVSKKRSKKPAKDIEKSTKDTVDLEDIVAHKKSKLMLEAKARLYERLKKSKNNQDNKFLVDFKNKLDESDEEFVDEAICKEYPIEPEEKWVEYQDCFGRTRKCLREDLPHMQRKDDLIKQEVMKRNAEDARDEESSEQYPAAQEKEPEIEVMRRKWEEQTRKLAEKVDIHYQDILFDEARAHGVGYYAFSQDEEERAKQQESLANLRKNTEKKQKEMKEIKELRDRMEQNRLKAARIRQRIRAGLPIEPTEEELDQENKLISLATTTDINVKKNNNESDEKNKESNEETDKSVIVEESNIANEKAANDEDKIKAFGELLGKKNHWHVMSQEEWVHKCREHRTNEFAPSYNNFTSAGFYNSSQGANEQLTHEDNEALDNVETCNSHKTVKDLDTNSEKYEKCNNSTDEKLISNADENASAGCETMEHYGDKEHVANHELPRNTRESEPNSAMYSSENLSDPSSLQRQATVSYPLSHLSSRYSQDICSYFGAHVPEQQSPDNMNDIPLPGENNAASTVSNNNFTHTDKQEALQLGINEDSIMAGLKYLREKFEKSHNK